MSIPDSNVKKINLKKAESVKWALKLEARSNKISSELSYTDDFSGWALRAPEMGSEHPDFPALGLISLSAERLEGYMVKVDLTYENYNPEAQYPGRKPGKIKRYSMDRPTSEQHIMTHPSFLGLLDAEREAIEQFANSDRTAQDYETARAAVDPEPFSLSMLKKIRTGIVSWLHTGTTWRETFTTGDLDDLEIAKVGKIYPAPGPAPALTSPANWLYVGATAEMTEDGKFYNVERTFQASLPTGWDVDLYGDDAPAEEG